MLEFLKRIASRPPARRDARNGRERHGPLIAMLECDMHNLDRLVRAARHGLPQRVVE